MNPSTEIPLEMPVNYQALLRQLSAVMQASVDSAELQEAILQILVGEMGCARAIIGLYDDQLNLLTGWIIHEEVGFKQSTPLAHTDAIPLHELDGPLIEALSKPQSYEISDGRKPTTSAAINERLVVGPHYLILPMSFAEQLIGVIIIDQLPLPQTLSETAKFSLEHLASYAGVALSRTRACIYRAQQNAITEERHRIASELHDNVSQALYGLGYGLDACAQLLADNPPMQSMMQKLHATTIDAQAQMRRLIFDMQMDEVTADTFVAGLHRHLRTVSPTQDITLRIEMPGQFEGWGSHVRLQLYRVAQEALANAAKHAHPNHIIVKLRQTATALELRVADDGEGFDSAEIDLEQHFGLHGMQRRMQSIGGQFEVSSMYGEGTLVIATVPYITMLT